MKIYNLKLNQWIKYLFYDIPRILTWKCSYKNGNFKSRCKTARCNYK